MNLVVWLIVVLPFVTLVWLMDVVISSVSLIYNIYYSYAYKRSRYLRERIIVNTLIKAQCTKENHNHFCYKN